MITSRNIVTKRSKKKRTTHLIHFNPFNLSIFPHPLNINIIITIIQLFLITTFVFFREDISNDEQQCHAGYITNSNDNPRYVIAGGLNIIDTPQLFFLSRKKCNSPRLVFLLPHKRSNSIANTVRRQHDRVNSDSLRMTCCHG